MDSMALAQHVKAASGGIAALSMAGGKYLIAAFLSIVLTPATLQWLY